MSSARFRVFCVGCVLRSVVLCLIFSCCQAEGWQAFAGIQMRCCRSNESQNFFTQRLRARPRRVVGSRIWANYTARRGGKRSSLWANVRLPAQLGCLSGPSWELLPSKRLAWKANNKRNRLRLAQRVPCACVPPLIAQARSGG